MKKTICFLFLLCLSLVLCACSCKHEWTEASCLTAGICRLCGETGTEALGHDILAADCLTPEHCSRCTETRGQALGHDYGEPGCEAPAACSRCGQTQGEALGHDPGDWTFTGGTEMVLSCSRCAGAEKRSVEEYLKELLKGSWAAEACYFETDTARSLQAPDDIFDKETWPRFSFTEENTVSTNDFFGFGQGDVTWSIGSIENKGNQVYTLELAQGGQCVTLEFCSYGDYENGIANLQNPPTDPYGCLLSSTLSWSIEETIPSGYPSSIVPLTQTQGALNRLKIEMSDAFTIVFGPQDPDHWSVQACNVAVGKWMDSSSEILEFTPDNRFTYGDKYGYWTLDEVSIEKDPHRYTFLLAKEDLNSTWVDFSGRPVYYLAFGTAEITIDPNGGHSTLVFTPDPAHNPGPSVTFLSEDQGKTSPLALSKEEIQRLQEYVIGQWQCMGGRGSEEASQRWDWDTIKNFQFSLSPQGFVYSAEEEVTGTWAYSGIWVDEFETFCVRYSLTPSEGSKYTEGEMLLEIDRSNCIQIEVVFFDVGGNRPDFCFLFRM